MTCEVCGGPALAVDGACVFCHSPVEASGDGSGLLDYVATHVPGARARRNLVGRGPVRKLEVVVGERHFIGRVRREELELAPEAEAAAWAAALVAELARAAASDHELRHALSRSGWALTQARPRL